MRDCTDLKATTLSCVSMLPETSSPRSAADRTGRSERTRYNAITAATKPPTSTRIRRKRFIPGPSKLARALPDPEEGTGRAAAGPSVPGARIAALPTRRSRNQEGHGRPRRPALWNPPCSKIALSPGNFFRRNVSMPAHSGSESLSWNGEWTGWRHVCFMSFGSCNEFEG